jgi:hypothetical protein
MKIVRKSFFYTKCLDAYEQECFVEITSFSLAEKFLNQKNKNKELFLKNERLLRRKKKKDNFNLIVIDKKEFLTKKKRSMKATNDSTSEQSLKNEQSKDINHSKQSNQSTPLLLVNDEEETFYVKFKI